MKSTAWDFKHEIREVLDFPVTGISFKDIGPVIANPEVFRRAIASMEAIVAHRCPDILVSPDARGWLFAAPVAYNLGLPLHLVRKPGKLPPETNKIKYKYEYASGELHLSDLHDYKDKHVMIVDDVNATGGTALAIYDLLKRGGADKVSYGCFVDILGAGGRQRLERTGINTGSVVQYEQ